jgi:hypothetical protein
MKYKDLAEEWTQYWFQFILDTPDKPWKWFWGLSQNPNITWDIIQAHPDLPWNWENISWNPNITWDIIEQNPDKDWDWMGITINETITLEIIEQNLDKPWNWGRMLDNPNITWEFIKRNLDKQWDWSQLSDRKIKIEESWIYQRRVEHIKAFQIQRHWRNCSCNPKYKLAQRMLSRLYKS